MKQAPEKYNQSIPPAYSQQEIVKNSNASTSNLSSSVTLDSNEKTVETFVANTVHKWRFILRIFQMLNVIGSFGFQASANTVNKNSNFITFYNNILYCSGLVEIYRLKMYHYFTFFMPLNGYHLFGVPFVFMLVYP